MAIGQVVKPPKRQINLLLFTRFSRRYVGDNVGGKKDKGLGVNLTP